MAAARGRYIPALDGLRAFAVLSVIAYHMGFTWAQGGLLGVTVFFVLSGYLITGLLILEFRSTGRIDLPQFWLRRVRRLVPAIITVIVATAALCTLFNHALLTKMRPDIIPSLFFFSNWWQIFHDISYFEALGAPSPLQHFWSLAIEEQFYLIWPVLLLGLFKAGTPEKPLRRGILVLALISVVEMALLYSPEADPSRMYYGTDTRAFSLLIGAWLAFQWPAGLLGDDAGAELPRQTKMIFDGIGIAAFVGLVLMVGLTNGFAPFLYRGGLLLCSVLTAIMIAVIAHPMSMFGKLWASKPLVWIGKRSYGMYLWHYPILLLMTDRNSTSGPIWWWCLLELAIIFAVSAASYTFIENPVRTGKLGAWIASVRAGEQSVGGWVRGHLIPVIGAGALTLTCILGVALVPPESAVGNAEILKEAEEVNQEEKQEQAVEDASQVPEGKYNIVLIGDSIAVGIEGDFDLRFPQGLIDGQVSRQMTEAQQVYDYYNEQDVIGKVVVFALGTNGVITDDMIDDLVADVGSEKKIYFVNTRSPHTDIVPTVNAALDRAAELYDNVEVIDWYGESAGHDEWFYGDGIHPSPEGAEIYCEMIREAIGFPKVYDKDTDPNYMDSFQPGVDTSTLGSGSDASGDGAYSDGSTATYDDETSATYTDNTYANAN